MTTDDAFMTHVQRTVFEYDYSDEASWWIDKMRRKSAIDEPAVYKHAPWPDAADNGARTVVSTFRWRELTRPVHLFKER